MIVLKLKKDRKALIDKLSNENNAYIKRFLKNYNGIIEDMKADIFSPPIAGKYKGVHNLINENLAFDWALRKTI